MRFLELRLPFKKNVPHYFIISAAASCYLYQSWIGQDSQFRHTAIGLTVAISGRSVIDKETSDEQSREAWRL